MATSTTMISSTSNALIALDVRVWGMDTNEKPFIQAAVARHITERTAMLDGAIPVKLGDTIGLQFEKRKARFKVNWVGKGGPGVARRIGVDCLEEKNIWGIKFAIPMQSVGMAALYSPENKKADHVTSPPDRRKSDRLACRFPAEVCHEGQLGQSYAWVSDMSSTGCYLQLLSPFSVDETLVFSMFAADLGMSAPLRLPAIVRASHPMVGMGIEFQSVSPEDRQAIDAVLELLNMPNRTDNHAARVPPPPTTALFKVPELKINQENTKEKASRISMDLQQLEMSMNSGDFDPRLLRALRDSATHARNIVGLVQQWIDLRERNQDPFIVMPEVANERMRAGDLLTQQTQ